MHELKRAILVIFCWASSMPGAFAYQCQAPRDFGEEVNSAIAIFEGRITHFEQESDGYRVTFAILAPWKGVNAGEEIDVHAPTLGDFYGSCVDALSLNEEYLVYAHEKDGRLTFEPCGRGVGQGQCDRTQLLRQAAEDLRALQEKFKTRR